MAPAQHRLRRCCGGLVGVMLGMMALNVVAAQPALRVCLLSHNEPYASRTTDRGFDLDLAREVAAAVARPLTPVWTDNPTTIQEIDDSDFPVQRLAKGACDAIFSMPGPARDTLKDMPELALGVAYYGAAFELIGPPATAPYLKALRGKPVAIQAQTIASFAIAILRGKQRTYFSPLAALEGVQRGDAVAALVWGPSAGWQLLQHPTLKLGIAKDYAPPPALAWNLHVATRKRDHALRSAIDSTLKKLSEQGRLQAIAARYGIPLHAPFAVTYSLTEINKLRERL